MHCSPVSSVAFVQVLGSSSDRRLHTGLTGNHSPRPIVPQYPGRVADHNAARRHILDPPPPPSLCANFGPNQSCPGCHSASHPELPATSDPARPPKTTSGFGSGSGETQSRRAF